MEQRHTRSRLVRRTPRHACRVVLEYRPKEKVIEILGVDSINGPEPDVSHLIGDYVIAEGDTEGRHLLRCIHGRILARMREAAHEADVR